MIIIQFFYIGQVNIEKVIDKFYYKREYTQKNLSHFPKKIKNGDWEEILNFDFLKSFSCFYSHIRDTYETCYPIKKVKITYANKNPWISNDLKMEIAEREKLYVKYKKKSNRI